MSTALRDSVGLGPVIGPSAEVNKYKPFKKSLKVGANLNSIQIAQKVINNDSYSFNVLALNYNQVAPNPMLKSTWKIVINGTDIYPGGNNAGQQLDRDMVAHFSNDITGSSKIGFKPCPVSRLIEAGEMRFGASNAEIMDARSVDDLIASYPPEDYDTDLGFAGAGSLGYGKCVNKVVSTSPDAATDDMEREITVYISEPLIGFPSLLSGDSCQGHGPKSAFQGLSNFSVELTLQGLGNLDYLKQKLLAATTAKLGNVTSITMTNLDLEVNLTLPNTFTWGMKRETLIPYLYCYSDENDISDNKFQKTLSQSLTMWNRLSVKAYKVVNGYEVPCKITKLEVSAVNSPIKGLGTFSSDRLYQMSRKNGMCRQMGNNDIVNTLGSKTILADVEDLSMAQVQIVAGDSVTVMNWNINVTTEDDPTKIVINRYVSGVANLTSGTFVSEAGLFGPQELSQLAASVDSKQLPVIQHKAWGVSGGGIGTQQGSGFFSNIWKWGKRLFSHVAAHPEIISNVANMAQQGKSTYQDLKKAATGEDGSGEGGVSMKRMRYE